MDIKIIKESDDPLGILRASIGGTPEIGYYLVYRGDLIEVRKMLSAVLSKVNGKPEDV